MQLFKKNDLNEIKGIVKKNKSYKELNKYENVFCSKLFKLTFGVGIVLSLLIALMYIYNSPTYDVTVKNFLLIFLSGMVLFLFISAGVGEFIAWFKRKEIVWKILSMDFGSNFFYRYKKCNFVTIYNNKKHNY